MKLKLMKYIPWFWVILVFYSCNKEVPAQDISDELEIIDDNNVLIDVNTRYQKIESFMASDCWMPNIVGTYWGEDVKSDVARLLFSSEIKDGTPQGIGLSGWRFVLGGGSFNQGASSDIELVDRRSESFMDPEAGVINWNKQLGQLYFLNKAKEYGVDQFVLFSNSPPAYLTKNGKTYSSSGEYSNLKEDKYDAFAEYMTSSIVHIKKTYGIVFNFVSPINEPQYNWDQPNQEGSGWHNAESFKLIKALNQSIEAKGLNTKILFGEAGSYNYLFSHSDKPNRGNLINDFFKADGLYNITGLPSVEKIVSAHSYWTDGDWQTLMSTRNRIRNDIASAGIKLYQTEWSMLGDHFSTNEFVGFNKANQMDVALYMSKVIFQDLTVANASSWSFWTSMDVERWGHKNRFYLIRLLPHLGDYGDVTAGGTHAAAKTLWVLGNYSLFVRPDYTRVKVEVENQNRNYFAAGFISPDKKTFVMVYTNNGIVTKKIKANPNLGKPISIKTYTTSESNDLKEKQLNDLMDVIEIPSKSVVSVKYTFI